MASARKKDVKSTLCFWLSEQIVDQRAIVRAPFGEQRRASAG